MQGRLVRTITRWLAAGTIGVAACSDSPTAPGIQPEVVNAVDNFQYQVTAIQGYTGTNSYTWQNTGTAATINQSASVTGGSATLVLLDASGTQVYSRSLADNGTFSTSAGVAGNWTVRIVYNSTNATVNFRADKAN